MDPIALARSVPTLGSLPEIYHRLMATIRDPRSSVARVSAVLGEDPGVSLRILRVANSALYAQSGRVDTISRAVRLIGTEQVGELVLATSVLKMFAGLPAQVVSMDAFWRHSLACAVAAREIAVLVREPNVERLFLLGLLHDVGSLLLYAKLPSEAMRILEESNRTRTPLDVVERTELGFDHAAAGCALLELWNLPPAHREVIRWHHTPRRAQHSRVEAAIVHLADVLAHGLEVGCSGVAAVPPLESEAYGLVSLESAVLPKLLDSVEEKFGSAVDAVLAA